MTEPLRDPEPPERVAQGVEPLGRFALDSEPGDLGDQFRHRGVGSTEETGNWMHSFSEILLAPPQVEILRVSS